ncbi:hypothetical protein Q7C36_007093 [Tachysurus vachellii]|uniref:C2H2-type domain-containing protein n=1 Tax=Tachysurus vachellii TaxID=175792 RepID=A0AA88NG41_TACVA|nr:hypothetical protein Q7C36_007093 [Tachysurus vachellii]
MEIVSKEMVRAVGAERQRDVNIVKEPNECTQTWSVPKLEASSDEEVVSRGFSDDVCCLCGGNFSFLDHPTEHFIKHTDEVCCHLCPTKFPHINSLDLHLKNAHTKYNIFCKSCNMGRHRPKQWTVEIDKTLETPQMTLLDDEVEEVKIENEEFEIKYVKEEEKEVVVGKMEETERNSITETSEDDKMVNRSLHDHNYFFSQACSSIRENANNVVLYTSNENVLVLINKTDTGISPNDSYSESDQQETPVDDQAACKGIHDHTYFSFQSLENHTLLAEQAPVPENMHVFNNKADSRIFCKDPESTESDQNQDQENELVSSGLIDHTYFSRQTLENHAVLSKVQSKENILKNPSHGNNADMTDQETTMLEASQLEYKMKVEEELCEFEPVQEDEGMWEHVGRIQRSDHEDSDTGQEDQCSDTVSCTSTGTNDDTSVKDCQTRIVIQKQNDENTNQKPLRPVGSVNSYPATSLYKDLQTCAYCGLSKLPNTVDSMVRCTCTQAFTCSLCVIAFSTEQMLLTHQAEKHPLAKYMCGNCLQLFHTQNIFIQHVCSKPKGFSEKSLTPSNISDSSKELLLRILNVAPSPAAAAESSKQPLSCQGVDIIKKPQNLETMLNSTSHSLPNSASISDTQKAPVQVTVTRTMSHSQKNNSACCTLNGDQGQVMIPISTGTEKQIGQVQVLSPLQAKLVTPTSSSTSSNPTQIHFSPQSQGQLTAIPTVTQTKSGQIQGLTPHTPAGSAELTTRVVQPQLHPAFGVHLPHPFQSQISNSVSIPSQTDQLPKSSVPFLDICRYSQSTQIHPSSPRPLKIVAMFVNQSKELALQKRMCQSWRSKAVFPCRQCGALSRQFSLGVRHRYQHRGPRLYRCQCGRTFHQRMHLLRHQVQHAEATRYICAACGQMFCGTKQLACHRPLFRITQSNRKKQANKECRNIFQCNCGHSFTRPAALLWHMLKNSKARKLRLKGLQYITVQID